MIIPAINNNLNIAKEALLNGEPIIYPTDTLYSFGAIATDTKTINLINKMKKRESPLSIVVQNIEEINSYGYIKDKYTSIIKNILPGKYTILIKSKKHKLSNLIQNNSELIGVRIPKHDFTIKLVEKILKPIITTSVNIHGENPLTDINDIEKTYSRIKIFYDKETLDSKGSTILDLSKESIEVVRKGEGKIIR